MLGRNSKRSRKMIKTPYLFDPETEELIKLDE